MPHRTLQLHPEVGLWPLTWPMGLTLLRLLLLPVFLWMVLIDAGGGRAGPPQSPESHAHRFYALSIFVVMAVTDKLDGYLARRLNQASKLGALLDPVADKLLIACSLILLSFDWVAPRGYAIPLWVVGAVYVKDLVVAVGTLCLLSRLGTVSIRPRPLGKLSTVLQLGVVMATLVAPDLGRWRAGLPRVLLPALWWGVTGVAVASCVDYVVQGIRTYRASRP
jgi:CDP-diacylglycerol--glycerol-3-phosphate 3-phosphatidyltransferase